LAGTSIFANFFLDIFTKKWYNNNEQILYICYKEVGMKKWLPVIVVIALLFGCGPKGASQETIDRLNEAKIACESAEARAKNLEAEKIKLEEELAKKEAALENLQKQLEEKTQKK